MQNPLSQSPPPKKYFKVYSFNVTKFDKIFSCVLTFCKTLHLPIPLS